MKSLFVTAMLTLLALCLSSCSSGSNAVDCSSLQTTIGTATLIVSRQATHLTLFRALEWTVLLVFSSTYPMISIHWQAQQSPKVNLSPEQCLLQTHHTQD